jgi:hypothetical protein
VYWAAGAYLLFSVAMIANAVLIHPELRDEEYGRRVESLRKRVAENPGRPLVLVIGSSRAAMGICPQAWEDARPGTPHDPLLFNMSRVGAGPLFNLMTLRRLYTDGIRPHGVLLEYWPPLLDEEGPFREVARISPAKLSASDRDFIRGFLPQADRFERQMLATHVNPFYAQRTLRMREFVPTWLPRTQRVDAAVHPLDRWGWLPGQDRPALMWESRDAQLMRCEKIYRPHLAALHLDDGADQATRAAIAVAREQGSQVGLIYLPESTEFRAWYTPDSEQLGATYLATVRRELSVPLINARTWLPDESLADGFHATRTGAQELSRRFGAAIQEELWFQNRAK